jgi:prepilin-type N-terminal cleavage/methylation domain-containing protein
MRKTARKTASGFSFIEVMLVVVIIGVLSAIAIPALIGQKTSAQAIGDAQQNAKGLQMMLETSKADSGIYGAAGTTTWTPDQTTGVVSVSGTNVAPLFGPKGSTKMTYVLNITSGTAYTLTVNDKNGTKVFQTDQTGKQVYP